MSGASFTVPADDVEATARALARHLTTTQLEALALRLVREVQSRDNTPSCPR